MPKVIIGIEEKKQKRATGVRACRWILPFVLFFSSYCVFANDELPCRDVVFSHFLDENYVISVDPASDLGILISVNQKIGSVGEAWSLVQAHSQVLEDKGSMFYVVLSSKPYQSWGVNLYGTFSFYLALAPFEYSPWAFVSASPAPLFGAVVLHAPALSKSASDQDICLVPTSTDFASYKYNFIQFRLCVYQQPKDTYWVPHDVKTNQNCAESILAGKNYRPSHTTDPASLCSTISLQWSTSDSFVSYFENAILLSTQKPFSWPQIWRLHPETMPDDRRLYVSFTSAQQEDASIAANTLQRILYPSNGWYDSPVQKWRLVPTNDTYTTSSFFIVSAADPNLVIASNIDSNTAKRNLVLKAFAPADMTEYWQAVDARTGVSCNTFVLNYFSNLFVGNIISKKTGRAAMPRVQEVVGADSDDDRKKVVISWESSVSSTDLGYAIPARDLASSATAYKKKLRFAGDTSQCLVPDFSPTKEPDLFLVNCSSGQDVTDIWEFGDIQEFSRDVSQFCVTDKKNGKTWCLADLPGSFTVPLDEKGQINPDTLMSFHLSVAQPILLATGTAHCIGLLKADTTRMVAYSCHNVPPDALPSKFYLVPVAGQPYTSSGDKNYYIQTITPLASEPLCLAGYDGPRFIACQHDPRLYWAFSSFGHVKNVAYPHVCLGVIRNPDHFVVDFDDCDHIRSTMVFYALHLPVQEADRFKVYFRLHLWDINQWTDHNRCVTYSTDASDKRTTQQTCENNFKIAMGQRQLWWRDFEQGDYSHNGVLSTFIDKNEVMGPLHERIRASQATDFFYKWPTQRFILDSKTFQAYTIDAAGISYCYDDHQPTEKGPNVDIDVCRYDEHGFGNREQTWLFDPVLVKY